jgi:hemolysin activation/secretion protein
MLFKRKGQKMKKMKIKKNIPAFLWVCAALLAVSSAAIAAPPALPPSIRSEIGNTLYPHDIDTMRYDRQDKDVRDDYGNYRRIKDTGSKQGTEVIQGGSQDASSIRGNVENIETDGVYVNSVQVSPSDILTQEEITKIIQPLVGKNVFIDDIQNVIDNINNLYAAKGYVTARAFLPEQKVEGGKIYIELIESKIGDITVENNRWTKSKYVTDRMPEKQGELFDIVELERDILDFNRYNEGVTLKANLKAGTQPGTTDVELIADEKFPFHLTGIVDNQGRYSTGSIRGGAMLSADSLFGKRDRLSVGSYFSGGAQSPFLDYNIPVNKRDGRVGFTFASSFANLKYGNASWMDIKSRAYIYSLYYSQPLIRKPGFELKSYNAISYKRSAVQSGLLFEGRDWLAGLDQVGAIETGLQLRKDTKYGIWYADQNAYYAIPVFDKDNHYFKYSGNVIRLHDFSHGVIGQIRGNYQIIPGDKTIPYIDQMQTGGLATVRGYSEGIMIGKSGYFTSAELMFPLLPREITGRSGDKVPFVGKYIKGAIFADHAGIFPAARDDVMDGSYFLMSIGMGLRVQFPGDLSGRIYWGYPLVNNAWEPDRKFGRIHFELSLAPDIDALLRGRSTAPREEKPAQPTVPVNDYTDVRHYDYFRDGGGAL